MKIICVEDGSVDLEAIEQDGLKDGGILVYRQGSQPPYVLTIEDRENTVVIPKEEYEKLRYLADECLAWRRKYCNTNEIKKEEV